MEKALTDLKKYKKELIIAPSFKIIEVIIELIMPFIVSTIIDKGLIRDSNGNVSGGNTSFIIYMSLLMLGLSILAFSSTMVCQYTASKTNTAYADDLRNDIFTHYSELSKKEIESFGKDRIVTLLTSDINNVSHAIGMLMRMLIRAPILVIGSVICAFIINIYAGLIFLGTLGLASILIFVTMRLSAKGYTRIQQNIDKMNVTANDNVSGSRIIRAFNKEEYEINKFKGISKEYKTNNIKISFIESLNNPLTFFFVDLGIILILYLGNISFKNNVLTDGQIISLISFLNQALLALVLVSHLVVIFVKAFTSGKRINEFFKLESSVVNNPKYEDLHVNKGESIIKYDHVYMSFKDNDFYSIKDISFNINKGETIGIIGGTGSGKSVIIKLLERFYNPSKGTIYYKGKDIKDVDLDELHSEISLVSQKYALLKGTIRSNMLLGNRKVSESEIKEALKLARADFVNNYEDGIDHEVSEGGNNFSGGQKQRLNIARALLKEKEILILDDSMSSLDYLTDKQIRNNIKNNFMDLTTIIISQRASSLLNADKIIVVDHGEIVDIGTHPELLQRCNIYKEIYETQVANL
jgi:ATP-binding cassette subfamily B multidrug efflux pump